MSIWVIIIAVMVLSFIIQQTLQHKFDKYSKIRSPKGMTGADIARLMLEQNGIHDVTVQSVPGKLTDHFNPQDKTINLSESVYSQASIAACAVAAHETGHAIQYAKGYGPLRFRSAIIPVVTFANNTVQWVLLAGIIVLNIVGPSVLWLGIAMFAMTTLFSFITLPVEINASVRAVQWLERAGIVNYETKAYAEDALKWAAYTYVIAAIGSLATLLYYISIANNRR
ncbi:MAG: zinc metallopeptidase [Bacteroidales bacterium]|nr:zinc metallopeptidase [Bacteroidales bacterium]